VTHCVMLILTENAALQVADVCKSLPDTISWAPRAFCPMIQTSVLSPE
jgi:hypothetical protein